MCGLGLCAKLLWILFILDRQKIFSLNFQPFKDCPQLHRIFFTKGQSPAYLALAFPD